MLEKSFNKVKRENPYWSDLICFNSCISGKKFSKTLIRTYFKKLVDKQDYSKSDLEEILKHSFSLTT